VCKTDGTGTECTAAAGAPGTETCDQVDNDCDGATDETFKDAAGKYATNTTCGNCVTDCTAIYARPNARGVCDATPVTPACQMVCNAGFYDLNAVPDDGCEFQLDPTAIYVGIDSVGAIDDGNCGLGPVGTGTGNHPCKSIWFGLGRVSGGRNKVLVADGLYTEQLTLANGVSVLGGFRADTWERHLSSTGTIVRAPEGAGDRKTIIAVDINIATVIEGLVVNAANATSTGANSYGIYVRNSTGALVIRNNLIFAALGGPGSTGSRGTSGDNGVVGTVGLPTKHLSSCSSTPNNAGGAGGQKQCLNPGTAATFTTVSGGKGGDSVCPARNKQEGSGATGSNSGGAGGAGGWGHESTTSSCYPSSSGPETGVVGFDAVVPPTADGAGGGGCTNALGSVVGDEWRGSPGLNGGHGAHGGGGGGGGAGSGGIISSSSFDISGSGGGGGSGGCAGSRGGGGVAGGGSFGVFINWSLDKEPTSGSGVPSVTGNIISRNHGGPGGAGGNGGAGGDPGAGALGGALVTTSLVSPDFCVFGGAKGGFGSRGGHGGGGGGGCGGASFDIFAWGINGQSHNFATNTFVAGSSPTGGEEGVGGNSSNTTNGGSLGLPGASGTVHVTD